MFKVKFDAWSFLVVLLYVIMLEVILLPTMAQSVACPVAHPGLHIIEGRGGGGAAFREGYGIPPRRRGVRGGSLLENC